MVKIGAYNYELSTSKNKKLMTYVDGIKVHFGDKTMQHYFDRTKLLPTELNHMDKKRRVNYIARASGIKNKYGRLTKDDPSSANYHSIRILW